MEDSNTKSDKRAAKRRKARYGMTVSGKSARLHHALALRRGLSKRVRKLMQQTSATKPKTKDSRP